MTKLNTKFSETLALLLVVALAPASIAFAQTAAVDTSTDTTTENKTDTKTTDKNEKRKDLMRDEFKRKVKDAIADRKADRIKDEIKTRAIAPDRNVDRVVDLTFRGQTDGWAILGGVAFKSSIGLVGDAYHMGGGNWKIKSTGDIKVADKTAKLDLTGHARANKIHLKGTGTLNSGETIELILKGHFAPTSDTNVYAIAFTNAAIHYKDSGVRVPLMQVGHVTVSSTTPTPQPTEPVPLPAQQ